MCIPLLVILLIAVFGAHLCFTMPNVAERLTLCAAYDTRLLWDIHVHLFGLTLTSFHTTLPTHAPMMKTLAHISRA